MKQSSNSCKHTPAICNPHNRTPDRPCVVPVYERFSPLADLLRLAICALAAMLLVALLVPVAFAADEREPATPVAEYIPVVSTAAEPVLTTAVAEVYAQDATDNTAKYYTLSTNEGNTLDKLSDAMVQMCEVMMTLAARMWVNVALVAVAILCNTILAKEIKNQIKELSAKVDSISTPSNKP